MFSCFAIMVVHVIGLGGVIVRVLSIVIVSVSVVVRLCSSYCSSSRRCD